MRRRFCLAPIVSSVLLISLLPAPASPWQPRQGPSPNVRPFFAAGHSQPLWFADLDRGYGLGAGFEIEHASRVSAVLRIEWNRLHGARDPEQRVSDAYHFPPPPRWVSTLDWAVGLRGYWSERALRPYAEACLGVRVAEGRIAAEGLGFTIRMGLSAARPGGAGMFLDSGLNLGAHEPTRYGIVPTRLGIVFP
jgi:hypothetical protein